VAIFSNTSDHLDYLTGLGRKQRVTTEPYWIEWHWFVVENQKGKGTGLKGLAGVNSISVHTVLLGQRKRKYVCVFPLDSKFYTSLFNY
jgi:hypothetical protein